MMMRNSAWAWLALRSAQLVFPAVLVLSAGARGQGQSPPADLRVVDLSLLVAPELPANWSGGMPPFEISHYLRIGPHSPYNSDILTIDEHSGTQWDAPAHFIPPPGSKFNFAGPAGEITAEKVPAWQFCGEACVIDCRALVNAGRAGESALVTREMLRAWEEQHRPLGPGDVVLFYSGYSDAYYRPLPEGRRYIAEPLEESTAAWPDPDPPAMAYLAAKGVLAAGTDSPSMGPLPGELASATHVAGLRSGMIWTEGATGLGQLPATGAFYCLLGPKHAAGSGGEARALAIVDDPLARQLIRAARNKRVVDLSVTLAENLPVWWPGAGKGNHRHPYYAKVFHTFGQPGGAFFGQTHRLDSHTGTHLVPPAYALPRPGFDNQAYSPEVRAWLAEYEALHGPRGTSEATADKVPLAQTCGPARIIDVGHLVGSTRMAHWPASPEITVADIQAYEQRQGELRPGEVVLFRSGYSDRWLKPFPEGDDCISEPLNGNLEGWPAPGPQAIHYLADKGVACVGTDGPTLGGAGPKRALWTYWALGSRGLAGVEFLTNLAALPEGAWFLFAAVKIRDCHGGPGRALGLVADETLTAGR